MSSKPMIIQGDGTILLEVESESYPECRDWLSRFAELVKSPEHIHTYKITPIAIWNAAASGLKSNKVLQVLEKFSKYSLPQNIVIDIRDWFSRYGKIKLEKITDVKRNDIQSSSNSVNTTTANKDSQSLITFDNNQSNINLLVLSSSDDILITEIFNNKTINKYVLYKLDSNNLLIDAEFRGRIKNSLIKIGYPVEDLVGYVTGDPLPIEIRDEIASTGEKFNLRRYQQDASEAFYVSGTERGGSGVIVLPCGAGKTVVGIDIISKICQETLIIGSSTIGVRQWIRELVEKSSIDKKMIGEYTGDLKEIKPVTVTTYQCLTYSTTTNSKDTKKEEIYLLEKNNNTRNFDNDDATKHNESSNIIVNTTTTTTNTNSKFYNNNNDDEKLNEQKIYPHLEIFRAKNWGLIIYDEVHLLPAPVFRITADIQAKRRLGLTATLVREDNMEDDVFSLIGPKKFDSPWKELERQGWIAEAACYEIRIGMDYDYRMRYATSPLRMKYRVAADNPRKIDVVKHLVSEHEGGNDSILIIGDYVDQLAQISSLMNAPIITGKTPNSKREKLYSLFRNGEIKLLVVSKVANYAIDLPDANVAIQISGTFGSRQEEAQRLGRILRPKTTRKQAYFYTIVSKDTIDQEYASKRQLFLTERGYK
ncbi:MAG: helicase-associated domain-containing protein, partial [Candidatus Nitrosocosmicus sp.]|nr:helicase-associated domain-containing protein [Candidatus Nitrosocosmicus sp.]